MISLELDPMDADYWLYFGNEGGDFVSGRNYTAKDCFERTLELSPECAAGWKELVIN